jgi:hypothetical protein
LLAFSGCWVSTLFDGSFVFLEYCSGRSTNQQGRAPHGRRYQRNMNSNKRSSPSQVPQSIPCGGQTRRKAECNRSILLRTGQHIYRDFELDGSSNRNTVSPHHSKPFSFVYAQGMHPSFEVNPNATTSTACMYMYSRFTCAC